jgi:uncharacterized protein (DUF2147 family)
MQYLNIGLLGALLAVTLFAAPAVAEPGALGVWATEEEKSHVEIYVCGDQLCGRIVRLKEPLNDEGTEKLDIFNEDESLRARAIVGLELFTAFVPTGEGKWKKGRIYNPEDGKTYKCKMELDGADTLRVRGFVGISILGKTQIWTRVAG